MTVITHRHLGAGREDECILLMPGEQHPHRQHLSGECSQPRHASSHPSPTASLQMGFFFSPRGAEKYFLDWGTQIKSVFTQKESQGESIGCPGAALHPEQSLLGRVGIPWGAFPVEWEGSRPCSACFARATPGASHGERSARGAKAAPPQDRQL